MIMNYLDEYAVPPNSILWSALYCACIVFLQKITSLDLLQFVFLLGTRTILPLLPVVSTMER